MDSSDSIKENTKQLANLGSELSQIQYDFKIKNKPSEKYWSQRIQEFKKYHEKTINYFTLVYSLMSEVNEEQSGIFLLSLSKLKQVGATLLEELENVKKNPAVMDLKDRQQSRWSIEQREKLIKSNNDCISHEKRMNIIFKEFYDNYLQDKSK